MTTLQLLKEIGSPALVRGVGYALLHSLWQGGVLALLLAGLLPLLRRQRAEVRYAVAAGVLASLVLVVGLTFGWYYQGQPTAPVPAVAAATTLADAAVALPLAAAPASAAAPLTTATTILPLSWLQANRHQLEAYLPLVVVAWLLGLLLMSGRLAGGLLYANRLRWVGTQALGAEWQQRLAVLARRAGVRQPVALLESARVAGPVVLGHLRPVILLPLGAVAGLSPALLEALLAHELAHIVRRDYLLNLGLAVAEVLFFYHPAVWFMATCLRAERENCCDDQAAALCGGDGLRVARALAALAELEAAATPTPRLALAAAGTGGRGGLLARVRRLALGRPQAPTMSERLLAGSLTLVGLLGLSTGVVLAARPAQAVPGQTAPAASPADTMRRAANAPALPALPGLPALPDLPQQVAKTGRATVADDEPEGRIRRWRQEPPRRGQASTVVIEKDEKGRVVNLTVDGQRIETDVPGKKSKHGKPVRTVEVVLPSRVERRVEVGRGPSQLRRIERLEMPERPEIPERPESPELPETRSFSFDFSTDEVADKAVLAARRGLAEALRNPDLTTEERQEMEKELSKLEKEKLKMHILRNGHEVRELHLNLSGSVASHPPHPTYRFERTKRGFVRMKVSKSGRVVSADVDVDAQVERNAEQAERNAAQAERNAAQAERNARRADANGLTADANARQAEANARRAELRARMAADAAELRALEGGEGRRQVPAPRPPRAPQGPVSPQAPPAPPTPPAPKTDKLRAALRQDGLLGKNDRNFSFELNDKGGRVNGQALTPAQVARYRQLLGQPVSGQGQSSSFNINVNEN